MISKLHYITQGDSPTANLSALKKACEAGADLVQLRIKGIESTQLRHIALQARAICNDYHTKLIINDFPLVAQEIGADGVHLGLQDMPTDEARKKLGDDLIIGGTANTLEDVLMHAQHGVDYVGLGPFRFTTTKKKLSPVLGVQGYQQIIESLKSRHISIPILAIGGIQLEDIAPIMATGVHGIAVSGLITHADDQTKAINSIKNLLSNYTEG
ncbi:MAG: thiamine phosphate synthase [Flammeovirgaceae bacterium]